MPTMPATGTWQYREDLALSYEEFGLEMNALGFVAHRMMPALIRDHMAGVFPVATTAQLLVNLDTTRNSGGTYKRSSREWSEDTYETEEYGLEVPLDDRTLKRYDDILDAEVFEGRVVDHALMTQLETDVADLLFSPLTWAGRTGAVAVPWDDYANAQPIADIHERVNTIRYASGVKPNALLVSDKVFRDLIRAESIISLIKFQNRQDARPGAINPSDLASALNIDEVIVADSMINTADVGQDATLAHVWGDDYALLARVSDSRNPLDACIGRTFVWDQEGTVGGGRNFDQVGIVGETYREEERRGDTLRRRMNYGLKLLNLDCGYLMSGIKTVV